MTERSRWHGFVTMLALVALALATFHITPPAQASGHLTPIYDIQGTDHISPFVGETVTTTGVVTAHVSTGYYVQDPVGDGDPATSDGMFVFKFGSKPAVGDLVELTDTVEEFIPGGPGTGNLSITEFGFPITTVLSSGNELPAPSEVFDLPNTDIIAAMDFWEAREGMLVSVRNAPIVGPTSRFGEFALVTEDDARPGSGFFPQNQQILIQSLGPNQVDYNPERILIDDASLDEAIQVQPGDRMRSLVGVVDYSFGNYKLQPISFDVKTHRLPNVPASQREGPPGNLTVATFNVANLFDLVDTPGKDDIGTGGAENESELDLQLSKLVLSIEVELELPAIIVLQEIENETIAQELGDRVNASAGTNYVARSFETSDGRGIEPGFLYDADRVTLLESFQLSGSDVEAAFGPGSASPGREPIYGLFDVNGEQLHIVGNHFKSKGGDDPIFGQDSLAGDPFTRITEEQRKLQAQVVRDFVNGLFASDPDAMVMVAGDLNDFQFGEPGEGSDHPLAILEGSGSEVPLHNLIDDEEAPARYTFIFDGQSQVLDHILLSPSLVDLLVASDILHFNAAFPAALSEEPGTPLRASDHDVLEARFDFDGPGGGG